MSADVEAALRNLAITQGVDPDKAVRDFRHGGPLARLIRGLLGDSEKPKPGVRARTGENWRRFVLVVIAKRRLAAAPDKEWPSEFYLAAHLDQRDGWEGDPDLKRPEMYRKTYQRMTREGWCDADVPDGLAALFAPPPQASDKTAP